MKQASQIGGRSNKSPLNQRNISKQNNSSNNNGENISSNNNNNNAYSIQITVRMRPLLTEFEDEEQWVTDKQSNSIFSQQPSKHQLAPSQLLQQSQQFNLKSPTAQGGLSQEQLAIFKRRYADAYSSYQFQFDKVFGPEENTESVYHSSCKDIVNGALNGFNSTIFMYGQTTSGKTFTMLGDMKNPGVLPYSLHDIFDEINKQLIINNHFELKRQSEGSIKYSVLISYIEIYNEQINDLLSPGMGNLRIHDDPKFGAVVSGMKQCEVKNFNEAIILMRFGEEHRCYKEKNIHEHSSRSHTIFQLKITSTASIQATQQQQQSQLTKTAVLNLVDLAGSERLHEEDSKNGNNEETGFINKSLFVLSNVINKLAEGKPNTYIPYRDSKLTRFLSNALGGNSMTGIICTISPAAMNFYQTLSTLRFATRAKKVYTCPVINEIKVVRDVSEMNKELDELHCKLQQRDSEIELINKDKLKLESSLLQSNKQINLLHREIQQFKQNKTNNNSNTTVNSSQNQHQYYLNDSLQQQQQQNQQEQQQYLQEYSDKSGSSNNEMEYDEIELIVHKIQLLIWEQQQDSQTNSCYDSNNNNNNNHHNKNTPSSNTAAESSSSRLQLKQEVFCDYESKQSECHDQLRDVVNRYRQEMVGQQIRLKDDIKRICEQYIELQSENLPILNQFIHEPSNVDQIQQMYNTLQQRVDNNSIFNGIAVNIILDPSQYNSCQSNNIADVQQHAVNVKAAYLEATTSLKQKYSAYYSLINILYRQSLQQILTLDQSQVEQQYQDGDQSSQLSQIIQQIQQQSTYLLNKLKQLFDDKLYVLDQVFQQVCSNLQVSPRQIYLPTYSDDEITQLNLDNALNNNNIDTNNCDKMHPLNEQNSILNIQQNRISQSQSCTPKQSNTKAQLKQQQLHQTPNFEDFLQNQKTNHQTNLTNCLELDDFSLISEQENQNNLLDQQRALPSSTSSLQNISPNFKKSSQSIDFFKEFADGTLLTYAWGSGKDGRLGNGQEKGENYPIPLINVNFIYLSCGSYHSAAISERGEVFMWGKGNSGQLGCGNFNSSKVPIIACIPKQIAVVQVVCGWQHTMALTSCGSVFSWGLGEEGQLGHNDTETLCKPKKIDLFTKNKKLVKFIACGHSHSAAITEEGQLFTWGCNYDYRLILNDNKNQLVPVMTELEKLRKEAYKNKDYISADKLRVELISLGVCHSAAITADGSVYTAGLGNYGELGVMLNEQNNTNQNEQQIDEDKCCYLHKISTFNEQNRAIDVACGNDFTVVVNSQSQLYQFGRKIVTNQCTHTPEIVSEMQGIRVLQVAAGKNHIAVITCYVHSFTISIEKGEVYTWGKNFYEKLEIGEERNIFKPQRLFEGHPALQCIQVSCGEFHSLCLAKYQKNNNAN